MPFFRDVAVGCYVRVGIGAHEGRMVYRVSQQPTFSFATYYCYSSITKYSSIGMTQVTQHTFEVSLIFWWIHFLNLY